MSRDKLCNGTFALSAMVIVFFAMAIMSPVAFADDTDPWTNIPEDNVTDWGEMWGNTIQFEYTYDPDIGNMAQAIEWDFGDESEKSTEWNPQHTYSELGTYTVVQHVTNSYEGYSEDWGYYRLTIMGKPYVEIITPEGADPIDKIYATKGTAPEIPETNPTWDGYNFVGYFLDKEHTVPFDWAVLIDTPVTVFAAFDDGAYTPVEPTDPLEPDDNNSYVLNGSTLIIIGVGLLVGAFAIYTKRPFVAILALILITISVLGVISIIDIPETLKDFEPIEIPFGGIL